MDNKQPFDDEDARIERLDKLQSILDKHHVTIVSKDKLAVLEDYNFVAICDDSESMKMSAKPKEQRKLGEKPVTRWHELQEGMTLLVELLGCFRPEGIDVHFLNAGKVLSVKSPMNEKLQNIFQAGPTGKTPLTSTLKHVANECQARSELPYIMFIFTDGEPDGGPRKFIKALDELVHRKDVSVKVQIMACSNNDDEIQWLNDLDKESDAIDVTDDYYNEKKRILAIKGDDYAFTRSDWVVKAILGPVDKSVDEVNEGVFQKMAGLAGALGRHNAHAHAKDGAAGVSETDAAEPDKCGACAVQ